MVVRPVVKCQAEPDTETHFPTERVRQANSCSFSSFSRSLSSFNSSEVDPRSTLRCLYSTLPTPLFANIRSHINIYIRTYLYIESFVVSTASLCCRLQVHRPVKLYIASLFSLPLRGRWHFPRGAYFGTNFPALLSFSSPQPYYLNSFLLLENRIFWKKAPDGLQRYDADCVTIIVLLKMSK